MTNFILYAELLRNINTVNVVVSLQSNSKSLSSATLSEDGSALTICYDEREQLLQLPASVSSQEPRVLKIHEPISANEVGFRLKSAKSSLPSRVAGVRTQVLTPWSAPALKQLECLHCIKCRSNVIKPLSIKTWKDLPSENWAEMMEFWHCHKPDVANTSEGSLKGYSASSRLLAEPSVGFVDICSFLVSPQDCTPLKVIDPDRSELPPPDIFCNGCNEVLGSLDRRSSGWRLFKSALAAGIHPRSVFLQHFPLEKWISALLLSTIEAQGSKKFLVRDSFDRKEHLLIWVFATELCVSWMTDEDPATTARVMKIFWKLSLDATPDNDTVTDRISAEYVELPLPHYYQALKSLLSTSQRILPLVAKRYQDWEVGLLQTFSDADV